MDQKWAYTVPYVADQLAISRSLPWRKVLRGEWRSITIGRARRIPADEVARLLADANPKKR